MNSLLPHRRHLFTLLELNFQLFSTVHIEIDAKLIETSLEGSRLTPSETVREKIKERNKTKKRSEAPWAPGS